VCVLPIGRIDMAIELALQHRAIVTSYGDCLRVPASEGLSLLKAKSQGADVRMVYSAADALKLAEDNPTREVVFFAIGFETTTPPTAFVIQQAAARGLENFSVLCCHVLTPAAIMSILESPEVRRWGIPPQFSFTPKEHWEIGALLGGLDFETAAKITGSRFVLLRGWAARLERALISFMLDVQPQEHGSQEVLPPVIVNRASLIGT
ncbi:MAG: hypothetical protein N3C59_10865, partial [Azovibrio sp.]|nr:hypothetical protein [Azovibrio sp.]